MCPDRSWADGSRSSPSSTRAAVRHALLVLAFAGSARRLTSRPPSAFRFFLKIATGSVDGKLSKDKPKPLPVFDRPLHILIVEDNDINSRVLSRQLLKASLTFESASPRLARLAPSSSDADRAPALRQSPSTAARAWTRSSPR